MSRALLHSTIPTKAPRDWLVAEYLLDWNANDTSWNVNDWNPLNISWVGAERGYVWKVASFNGSNSYISTPFSLNTLPISISMWCNLDTSSWWVFFIWNDNWGWDYSILYWFNWNVISAWIWTSRMDSTTAISYWEWNHIVLTIDISWNANLYLNNISIASSSSGADTWWASTFYIGKKETWTAYYMDGDIWLARIYDKVLSEDEIKELYLEWLR